MAVETPQYVNLAANTVATVTFANAWDKVRVTSVDGASAVYFTADGVTVPAINGTGSHFVDKAAGASCTVEPIYVTTPQPFPTPDSHSIQVKLIAAVATEVCVEGLTHGDDDE